MIPGATLSGPHNLSGKWKQQAVAFDPGAGIIRVRPEKSATFEFTFGRSQKFRPDELNLARCFVDSVDEIKDALGKPFETEVLRGLPLRVVARAAGGTVQVALLQVLEQFAAWAAEQYEGRPIVAAVGIEPTGKGQVPLTDVWRQAFAPVLTNGLDAILVSDSDLRIMQLLALPVSIEKSPSYSPHRYRALAEWATDDRVAVALNRDGEILVFRGQTLRFALRAGGWQHYPHEAALASIHLPHKKGVKTAMYETMLDVSFARSGGCLAVVRNGEAGKLVGTVASTDYLDPGSGAVASTKGQLIATAVGADFTALDRRIRAELLALDGQPLSITGVSLSLLERSLKSRPAARVAVGLPPQRRSLSWGLV